MTIDRQIATMIKRHIRGLPTHHEVPLDRDLRELGLDSMAVVNLAVDIETTLGIQFPDEKLTAETFRTAGSILAVVLSLVENNVSSQ